MHPDPALDSSAILNWEVFVHISEVASKVLPNSKVLAKGHLHTIAVEQSASG